MQRLRHFLSGPILVIGGFILFSLVWGSPIGPIRGFEGAIVAFLIAIGFFWGVLWLAGPHVLPIDFTKAKETSKARGVLRRFGFGRKPFLAVVREGKVLPGLGARSREDSTDAGAIDVDSTSVVVLVTDAKLSRIEGPGVVFTEKGEKIGQVVDLRILQDRQKNVELTTRDGVPIRVTVSARFQIDKVELIKMRPAQQVGRWPALYDWKQRTVRQALSQQSVGPGGVVISWDQIVLRKAIERLRTIVAEYEFDQLSEPQDLRFNPREEIKKKLQTDVRNALSGSGIKVLSIGIGVFFPRDFPMKYDPRSHDVSSRVLDEVTKRRVSAWQAGWQSHVMMINAQAKAEIDRRRTSAWSQAQMALITRLTHALEQDMSSGGGSSDRIVQHFLESLSKVAKESSERSLLSDKSLPEGKSGEKSQTEDETEDST